MDGSRTAREVVVVLWSPGSSGRSRLAEELESVLGKAGEHVRIRTTASAPSEHRNPLTSGLPSEAHALVVVAEPDAADMIRTLFREEELDDAPVPILVALRSAPPEFVFELLQLGATDFFTPPFSAADILPRVWRWREYRARIDGLRHRIREQLALRQLVGNSPAFVEQIAKIPQISKWDVSVLIGGETGTGKELCARSIHYLGPRASNPFVPVNCGAIPAELVENELFGHVRGAFTGATNGRHGLIYEADQGTIFLDEINCMPASAQVKLLRFLQEKEYRALGSSRARRADVRVIAATNASVEEDLAEGRLRADLYYRLSQVAIELPPLRNRPGDVELLAHHFVSKYAREYDQPCREFSPRALRRLRAHDWPGNVRELENVVQRAVLFSEARLVIGAALLDLPREASRKKPESFRDAKARVVARFETDYIRRLLATHKGNITHAAKAAGKNRRAFWELIRKHQIDANRYRP